MTARLIMIDLYIETLTGTAFELRVSPFETIHSVKNKIYRLEGIPVTQQHLVWNDHELNDDLSLHECGIPSGSTLRLVLGMRGGPINTRRVPLDVPYDGTSLSDLFPYSDGPTTFLVFRDGDQLNFFQVVDRGDGTLSPLAESISSFREDEDYESESEFPATAEAEDMHRRLRMVQLKLDQMRLNRRTAALRNARERSAAAAAAATTASASASANRDVASATSNSSSAVPPSLPPIDTGVRHNSASNPSPVHAPLAARSISYDASRRVGPVGAPRAASRSSTMSNTMPAKLPSPGPEASSASRLCPELIQIGSSRLSRLMPPSCASPLRHFPASGRGRESTAPLAALSTSPEHVMLASGTDCLPPVVAKTGAGASAEKSKRKKRCNFCNKKTGLANSYQCRCGNNFCAKHRYAEVHSCPYDYKAEGRRLIQDSNPVIAASKLPKI